MKPKLKLFDLENMITRINYETAECEGIVEAGSFIDETGKNTKRYDKLNKISLHEDNTEYTSRQIESRGIQRIVQHNGGCDIFEDDSIQNIGYIFTETGCINSSCLQKFQKLMYETLIIRIDKHLNLKNKSVIPNSSIHMTRQKLLYDTKGAIDRKKDYQIEMLQVEGKYTKIVSKREDYRHFGPSTLISIRTDLSSIVPTEWFSNAKYQGSG